MNTKQRAGLRAARHYVPEVEPVTACVSCSKFASVRICTADSECVAATAGLPEEAGAAGAAARAKGSAISLLLNSCQAPAAATRHKTRERNCILRKENIKSTFGNKATGTNVKTSGNQHILLPTLRRGVADVTQEPTQAPVRCS